jgi:hypothetical protein
MRIPSWDKKKLDNKQMIKYLYSQSSIQHNESKAKIKTFHRLKLQPIKIKKDRKIFKMKKHLRHAIIFGKNMNLIFARLWKKTLGTNFSGKNDS